MFFIGFSSLSYPILPQATTSIGNTKSYIYIYIYIYKFVIKLYTDHDTLWVKQATHQNAESLRTSSPSNLDNMVNNSSIVNTKYAEFSTKW